MCYVKPGLATTRQRNYLIATATFKVADKMGTRTRAHREEGQGGEGLGGGQLVAQQDVGGEGDDRHDDWDGVEQEAVHAGHHGGAPQDAQLLVPHALDFVPERVLHNVC